MWVPAECRKSRKFDPPPLAASLHGEPVIGDGAARGPRVAFPRRARQGAWDESVCGWLARGLDECKSTARQRIRRMRSESLQIRVAGLMCAGFGGVGGMTFAHNTESAPGAAG